MDILDSLTSQAKDGSDNYQVAVRCLNNQSLILEIVAGLQNKNNAIVIDCAEVLTEVAKVQPDWIAPYGQALPGLLNNKNNRARWEGMHCLALIANLIPDVIQPMLTSLDKIIKVDPSVIVRDYAIDAVGGYTKTSIEAAQTAFPILKCSLRVWEGRHAQHALQGLCNVATILPETKPELHEIALEHLDHKSGTVKKSAKGLLRLVAN